MEVRVKPPDVCVQGSFHQGDVGTAHTRGRQCTAICACAIAVAACSNPINWTPKFMDLILLYGDVLYSDTISRPDIQHDFLEPCDVKLNPFMNDGCLMKLKLHDPLSWRQGDNNVDGALCSRLEEVLEGEGFKAAYLVSFDYTMAIFKTAMGDGFWLFDSHAKDAYCKIKEDGKSFCGRYVTLQDLVCAYYQSYIIQPYSPFQLYPVSVIHTLLDPEEDPPVADNVPVLDPVGNGPPCGLQKNGSTVLC